MKKILFMLILFLLPLALKSQEGWVVVNHELTKNNLNAVWFIDLHHGWVAGDRGVIMNTTDGGWNWIKQGTGIESNLRAIQFIDTLEGWAVGDNGVILHTLDGGNYWYQQDNVSGRHLNSIRFINRLHGWVSGNFGTILTTTDGGNTWGFQNSTILNNLTAIFFVDSLVGWAGGIWDPVEGKTNQYFPAFIKTSDGGKTWIDNKIYYWNEDDMRFREIFFKDTNNGWFLMDNLVMCYDDGKYSQRYSSERMLSSIAKFNRNYWIAKDTGFVNYSTSLCGEWTKQVLPITMKVSDIFFCDSLNGLIVGNKGTILITNTGGMYPNLVEDSKHPGLKEDLEVNSHDGELAINYTLSEPSKVKVSLYNYLGNFIRIIEESDRNPGTHNFNFMPGISNGVYFISLNTGRHFLTKKVVIIN